MVLPIIGSDLSLTSFTHHIVRAAENQDFTGALDVIHPYASFQTQYVLTAEHLLRNCKVDVNGVRNTLRY